MSATDDFWRRRNVVYRCYDNCGRLLYIGVSSNITERLKQHRRSSPWWSEVDRTVMKVFARRLDAMRAERLAIKAERPAKNVRYLVSLPNCPVSSAPASP